MMDAIWNFLNQPVVITAIAGLVLWGLNRLYAARPTWQKWEGLVIEAIKYAEKTIPDDTPNPGLAKADAAAKYAITLYERITNSRASDKQKAELREAIPAIHATMEAEGNIE